MQADVKYELEDLRPNLFIQETEDSWEKIANAMLSLIKLCENGAYDTNPTELVGVIKAAYRPIVSAMNSERTRLCLVPMDLMGSLAAAMGMEFEQLLPFFLPPLLSNCARTNKVVVNRAKSAILAVIEGSQLASVLTYFLQNMKDKSSSMKIAIAEGTLACLNSCNPPDVEKEARALEIEAIIRITARDANADVRKLSRKIYESYTLLLPSRVKSFTGPLSPTTKKYLDIKTTTAVTTSSEPLQKSTSSLRPSSNPKFDTKPKPAAGPSTSKQTHSRTASMATISSSTNANHLRSQATTMTHVSRKDPAAAPTLHVPTRPVQASRVVSETSKSAPHRPTNLTTGQEEKRPVPPLRTQRSVISRTAQGPASSSGAPHRIQITTTTTKPSADSDSQPHLGPRRVPMLPPPPPPPAAPKKETEGPKRQPAKTEGSSSQRSIVPPAPVKKKSTASLSASVKDRVQASRPPIGHTRTKSSVVAMDSVTASTSVATAGGSVKPLVIPKTKPQWGRSATITKPVARPSQKAPVKATIPVAKKPSSRPGFVPKSSTTSGPSKKGSKDVGPELVPLPPSPPPTEKEEVNPEVQIGPQNEEVVAEVEDTEDNRADITESNTAIPFESVDEVDGDVVVVVEDGDEEEVEEAEETNEQEQDETASSSMTDTTAVHTSSINNKENIPISEHQAPAKSEEHIEEVEGTESIILSRDENPQTPQQQGLMPHPSANDIAAAKTPISALLSSIERGFKYDYSPITPLSPADCYLPNINGATPYSHHIHAPHIKGPMQPFNHALHAPGHSGIFGGFGAAEKPKEELVRGDIGVVQLSEYNKLYMTTSLPGLDDGRQTFIELNDN